MKKLLTNNIVWKLASLVIAAIIWFAIMNIADPVTTETFTGIPVTIINDDVITSRGYQYTVESGERVDIICKGKRSVLLALTERDFVATADFNTLNSMYMANITAECVSSNASEVIMSLRTENMAVKLEDQVTLPFSVKVVMTGRVRDGYYCYGSTLASSLVQVTGAASQVGAVKEVVAYVDIEDKSETFKAEDCELVAYNENGEEIDSMKLNLSQNSVDVTVGIYRTKSVDIEVVTTGSPVNGYYVEKVDYAPQSVMLAADSNTLAQLDKISLSLDVTGAVKPVESLVSLDEYIITNYGSNVYAVDDSTYIGIAATVSPFEERVIEIRESDIDVRNVDESLEYTIDSMSDHTLKVKGALDVISSVTAAELGLYVDMTDCPAGSHIRMIRSDYGSRVMIDTISVSVRLSQKPEAETGGEE